MSMETYAIRYKVASIGNDDPHARLISDPNHMAKIRHENFKRWFGDWEAGQGSKVVHPETKHPHEMHHLSRVVDRQGNPLTVYHGTSMGGFTQFDPKFVSDESLMGPGFYFTENSNVANTYSQKINPHLGQGGSQSPMTYQLYLNIRKPFDADHWQRMQAAHGTKSWWKRLEDAMSGHTMPDPLPPAFHPPLGHPIKSFDSIANAFGGGAKGKAKATQYLKDLGFDGITHTGGVNQGLKANVPQHRVWIAWHPTQIKSVDNHGTWSVDDPRIHHSV